MGCLDLVVCKESGDMLTEIVHLDLHVHFNVMVLPEVQCIHVHDNFCSTGQRMWSVVQTLCLMLKLQNTILIVSGSLLKM